MNELHYDIISDIHGRFDKLTALMERMGYTNPPVRASSRLPGTRLSSSVI